MDDVDDADDEVLVACAVPVAVTYGGGEVKPYPVLEARRGERLEIRGKVGVISKEGV